MLCFFKKNLPVFLLPVFFVTHGVAEHIAYISFTKALILLIEYLIFTFLLLVIVSHFFRSEKKASLICFYFLLVFCFFGYAHDLLKKALGSVFITSYTFIICLLIVCFLIAISCLKLTLTGRLYKYLTALFLLLIAIDAINIVISYKSYYNIDQAFSIQKNVTRPDIYLIVLDEYAGREQLIKEFDFTNELFYNNLELLGFYTMKESKCNYKDTPFSIASLLNMDTLALSNLQYTEENLNYCFEKIYNNKVFNALERNGYKVHNNSIFDAKGYPSKCKNTLLISGVDQINSQTLFERFKRDVAKNFIYKWLRNTFFYKNLVFENFYNNQFFINETLKEAEEQSVAPKFVYTHLEMPHAPYYFKANGVLNSDNDLGPENLWRKDLYLGNLKYSNQITIDFLRRIINKSFRPTIILLLSDHGYRYGNTSQKYYFSNLAAIYNSDKEYTGYQHQLENVNQFKILFNTVFKTNFKLTQKPNH